MAHQRVEDRGRMGQRAVRVQSPRRGGIVEPGLRAFIITQISIRISASEAEEGVTGEGGRGFRGKNYFPLALWPIGRPLNY
jgi:hypothetical protein